MPNNGMAELRERIGQVSDLNAAVALMHWDQEVNMPPKAAPGRGQQLATLSALAHRTFTDPELGDLLEDLGGNGALSDDEEALVRETRYDYQRAAKLPEAFVREFAEEQSKAYVVWVRAREEDDFGSFQPHLEKLVELLRRKAEFLGYEGSPYNALIEDYERGMTVEQLTPIFDELAAKQSALLERIVNAPAKPGADWLDQEWDPRGQWDFTLRVLEDMGYDLEAGRQDKSVHPFTTNFDLYDVRITTRIDPRELFSGLTGSIHEGGHALYEQGFLEADRRTPLAQAPSFGIHESQSRMWENLIGRSLPFWKHYLPAFQEQFKGQLDSVTPEDVFQAINTVEPSFIRVEADECTYNLHIVLRFEVETALIEGDIQAAEAPEFWNARFKDYLGLDVPSDTLGCLQDIHWSHGSMGYFPTYALGNLYAAQLFERILEDVPGLWGDVEEGNFATLLGWLRTHVHAKGRRRTAVEIVRDATGKDPGPQAYLDYLERKYSGLYGLAKRPAGSDGGVQEVKAVDASGIARAARDRRL